MKLIYSRTNKAIIRTVLVAAMFIALSFVMNSCKKPEITSVNFDASTLRVVNGLSGKTNVKFYLDSSNLTLTGTLNFTGVSQYYVVKSGLRSAKFFSTATTDTFATTSIQLDVNKDYTLFLGGIDGAPKYFLTQDDLTETTPDKVKIRLANLANTSGNVDVTIQFYDPLDPLLPVQPEVTILSNVASESVSNYVLATVPTSKGNTIARLHNIKIYEAGTANLLSSATNVDLRGTSINTLIATGISGGSPAVSIRVVREWLDW